MGPAVLPWTDRAGRFSALKLLCFGGTLLPGLWLAWQGITDGLGAKPLTEAIHQSGDWAVRFVLISLSITPLRYLANWPRLMLVRRMLGLAALAYAMLHLGLYIAEQRYALWHVASEIVLRFYLTIGFVALLGLAVLGATSTDSMVKRLGGVRWKALHKLVYLLAALGIVHFYLQSKIDVSEPVLMTGLFLWLMGIRLLLWGKIKLGGFALVGLALLTTLATALLEAGWYAAATGVMAQRVLMANLMPELGPRPAFWVLLASLAMLAIPLGQAVIRRRGPRLNPANTGPSARQA